jgi:hypothetical protein
MLLPAIISLTNNDEYVYIAGLAQPTGPLPIAILAAFILDIKLAAIGLDADVPAVAVNWKANITKIHSPAIEISGNPLPVAG